MQIYRKRDHWEDREDSEWRIEPDALVYRDASEQEYRYPWRDIVGVRAELTKREGRTRHVCSAWLAGEERSRCEFDQLHVVTVGEYEYRDDYVPFMRAVLTKIIEKSPAAKAWAGIHQGLYVWVLIGAALFLLIVGPALFDTETALTTKVLTILSAVIGAYVLIRGRPRSMPVSNLLEAMSR
ncbi:MAG TPA: hypothetical protein VFV70_09025 [Hyphomonadaceae bacterium]|nr:hypothetical protein [Hyphomonadaceae bacterium]